MLTDNKREEMRREAEAEAKALVEQGAIEKLVFEYSCLAVRRAEWEEIRVVLNEYSERTHWHHGGGYHDQVRGTIEHFKDSAIQALAGAKATRDDMLTYFRALVIVIESALAAATHKEKDARLRGAIDVLERTLHSLHKMQFDFSYRIWDKPDVFRSDYPTRDMMERIHALEHRLAELEPNDSLIAQRGQANNEIPF
jgi:hypothetical protein